MNHPKNNPQSSFLINDNPTPLNIPPMKLGAWSASSTHLQQIANDLTQHGHHVHTCMDAKPLKETLHPLNWDAVILDSLTLPQDSLTFLRVTFPRLQVLCLTLDSTPSRINLLRLGADTVLSIPASTLELELKLHTLWRRKHHEHLKKIGDWWLCESYLFHEGAVHPLTRMEFRLMQFLMDFPKVVHTREKLLEVTLESDAFSGHQRSIDVLVSTLRKKIPRLPLFTLRGKGYVFAP